MWLEREVIRALEALVAKSGLCPVCDSKPQEGFERGGEGDMVQSVNFKTFWRRCRELTAGVQWGAM